MEYKFIETVQGPAVLGEDEVLFFSQHGQLLDYYDSDPEFLPKAKRFIADGLTSTANHLATSIFEPVVGGDVSQNLYGFINALRFINEFEHRYLPSVLKN